jgi:hypothetical protein
MTRRGSLIYYLAAWALGCFFTGVLTWGWMMVFIPPQASLLKGTVEFLGFIVLGYLFGAPIALLFGFVLRRVMRMLKCKTPMHWAVAGAILAPIVVVTVGLLSRRFVQILPPEYAETMSLFQGTDVVLRIGWWLTIPAGAATSYYLGRIQRAFTPSPETAPNFSA